MGARCEELVDIEELLGRELTHEDILTIRAKADSQVRVVTFNEPQLAYA